MIPIGLEVLYIFHLCFPTTLPLHPTHTHTHTHTHSHISQSMHQMLKTENNVNTLKENVSPQIKRMQKRRRKKDKWSCWRLVPSILGLGSLGNACYSKIKSSPTGLLSFQLIRDVRSVSEATDWSVRGSTEAKYRTLRCYIEHLSQDSTEHQEITRHIQSSLTGLVTKFGLNLVTTCS